MPVKLPNDDIRVLLQRQQVELQRAQLNKCVRVSLANPHRRRIRTQGMLEPCERLAAAIGVSNMRKRDYIVAKVRAFVCGAFGDRVVTNDEANTHGLKRKASSCEANVLPNVVRVQRAQHADHGPACWQSRGCWHGGGFAAVLTRHACTVLTRPEAAEAEQRDACANRNS